MACSTPPFCQGACGSQKKVSINESGSMPDHVNVVNDETISYEVKSLTPLSLPAHLGVDSVAMLELDIEGSRQCGL